MQLLEFLVEENYIEGGDNVQFSNRELDVMIEEDLDLLDAGKK